MNIKRCVGRGGRFVVYPAGESDNGRSPGLWRAPRRSRGCRTRGSGPRPPLGRPN